MKGLKHQWTEDSQGVGPKVTIFPRLQMFYIILTERCKFLMEEIMCPQNCNFAFNFFQNGDLQAQVLHFSGQTFSDKKIFLTIFWQLKIYCGQLPHHLPPCHDVTDSESSRIGVVVSRIAHLYFRSMHMYLAITYVIVDYVLSDALDVYKNLTCSIYIEKVWGKKRMYINPPGKSWKINFGVLCALRNVRRYIQHSVLYTQIKRWYVKSTNVYKYTPSCLA